MSLCARRLTVAFAALAAWLPLFGLRIAKLSKRIAKLSKNGTFIKVWGKNGTGRGEFMGLHAMAIDSSSRTAWSGGQCSG